MGMFSWNCRGCGHPMLAKSATNDINAWMNRVIVITLKGTMHRGEYDGFGRVDGIELHSGNEPECWHQSCWRVAGQPRKYSEASQFSEDQGFFFDAGDHDVPEPTTQLEMKKYRSHWDNDPEFLVEDWKTEVENDCTRLGYLEWVENERSWKKLDEELGGGSP